jgi:hypothetical protein
MTDLISSKNLDELPPGLLGIHPQPGDQAMSTNMNRRAVLAGAAGLPAIAALSTSMAGPAADADAELLTLGQKLDPIIEEWKRLRAIDDADQHAFEAKVIRATGIAYHDAPEVPERPWPEGSYWAIREAIGIERPDADPELTRWDCIHDQMYPVIDDILARRAKTVAGLAVQARAITLSEPEMWDDADGYKIKEFIEAVCAFVGVTPVPLEKMKAAA